MRKAFWDAIDQLIGTSTIIIDRPKGSTHPLYPNIVYPLDYGFLSGTSSMDGEGIDIWRGSLESSQADAIICTLDLLKRDSEIKLLLGCTEDEKGQVLEFHNNSDLMKGMLISRR